MSQAKFAAAKQLIQEQNFEEARAILKTMSGAQANKWLTELDRIAPSDDKPSRGAKAFVPWIITLIAAIIAAVSLFSALRSQQAVAQPSALNGDVQRMFNAYCAYPYHSTEICNADPAINITENELVQRCFSASAEGASPELFINCMLMGNFPLEVPTMVTILPPPTASP